MSVYYTKDHEWIRVSQNVGVIGISSHAATQLGDVVYVELPELGKKLIKGEELAVVESVKAASEVYSPVAGEVLSVNETLEDQPQTVNESPDDGGWFVKISISDLNDLESLMSQDEYSAYCIAS
ncbi:MAG: glycine cleavage system protein GcvH [Hellea sp.]|nr:glycine cleavage system protein GcvH [Hellea sp.]MDG2360781.1 glycine cleavage system protein GcvH [Hellea sp.]